MSLRSFILGLSVTFGAAWLAIIVLPFAKMRSQEPAMFDEARDEVAGVFYPKRTGRIANGARVYAANGCYLCHTQLVRPTYAGNDIHRPDWGGRTSDPVRGDTRRETVSDDFLGERFAQVGVTRLGPDLSNLAVRLEDQGVDPAATLYAHLFNPRHRAGREDSACPSVAFMFDEVPVRGQRRRDAIPGAGDELTQVIPGEDAVALVSYLLSLRKDQAVPSTLNFAPTSARASN